MRDGITEVELDAGYDEARMVVTGDMETLRALAKELTNAPVPRFVLGADNPLAVIAMKHYRDACSAYGQHEEADEVSEEIHGFQAWQTANPGALKMPGHRRVLAAEAEPC